MKKIFLIFAVMAFAVSCLSSTYDTQYTTNVSFDYDNQTFAELKPKPDSLLYDVLYKIGFSWDHVGFYHNVD
jgi:hypothetical protein